MSIFAYFPFINILHVAYNSLLKEVVRLIKNPDADLICIINNCHAKVLDNSCHETTYYECIYYTQYVNGNVWHLNEAIFFKPILEGINYNDLASVYEKCIYSFVDYKNYFNIIPKYRKNISSFFKSKNNRNSLLDKSVKTRALQMLTLILLAFIIIFSLNDYSSNIFQFVSQFSQLEVSNVYTGVDGLSIYFVLLTTVIIPISLVSNWRSIIKNNQSHNITIVVLGSLLLLAFIVLDALMFYIFFESILPPLFLLIGLCGSDNKVRASFYLFLYTLLGSLFLLLSILAMLSTMGTTDFDGIHKTNFDLFAQTILFIGIFIAFAVKTPIIFLNIWLLKAHVESPLSGSIILAAIVLKLSLYGIYRLILPILPKASDYYTYIIYLIGVVTIIYAGLSTLRTIDIKELIAYSSVSHAAVYLMGAFSNSIQGIEGSIALGLAHGLVSSGLFICAGGVLYDRSSTRLITHYRGITQIMPVFCIMFFILCLGNCGVPLTFNFVGEFLSLYGATERLSLLGALASSSIVFSAGYTIYMYNRIAFAGSYSKFFFINIPDVNKREFYMLSTLIVLTIALGIHPNVVLDGIHYSVTTLIYGSPATMLFIPMFRTNKKYLKLIKNKYLWVVNIFNFQSLLLQPRLPWYMHLTYSIVSVIFYNIYFMETLHCMPNEDPNAGPNSEPVVWPITAPTPEPLADPIPSPNAEPKPIVGPNSEPIPEPSPNAGPSADPNIWPYPSYEAWVNDVDANFDVKKFCYSNSELKGPNHTSSGCEDNDSEPYTGPNGHQYAKSDRPVNSGDYCCTCAEKIENQLDVECQNCGCIHHAACQQTTEEYADEKREALKESLKRNPYGSVEIEIKQSRPKD